MNLPPDVLLILWRRKGVMTLLFLFGISIGLAVSLFWPRTYQAETLILIKKSNASAATSRSAATEPAIVHTRILTSTEVVKSALADVPLDPGEDHAPEAYIGKVRDFIREQTGKPMLSRGSKSLLTAMRNLDAGVEPGGEIIRVTFRFGEPDTASAFVNAVTTHYASRLQQLSQWRDSNPIATREDELVRAYQRAYGELTEFSSKTKLYSSDEQQRLALKRRNDLSAAMAETRGAIEDKTAQLATYPEQLAKMKPLARVLGSTDLTGEHSPTATKRGTIPDNDASTYTPPQLLQRVYQDTVQTVVKLRTELAGLEKKIDQQLREQQAVDAELNALSQQQAQYNTLELRVSQTRADAEAYSRWVTDQRSLSALPEVQVLQSATPPIRPVFPRPELVVPFCALLSILFGAAAIVGHGVVLANRKVGEPIAQDLPIPDRLIPEPPTPRNWSPSIKKLESPSLLKQLGSGSA